MARRLDVAIVGAGVIGLSVAWQLRERGVRARVFERTGVGAGASGVQPGGVRQQWGTRINCLLARESVAFYRTQPGFRPCGYLFLAHTDAVLERLRENVRVQNEAGVPSRVVAPDEAALLVPGLATETVRGGAWCGEDGYFDNGQAVVEALAAAADVEIAEVVEIGGDGKLTLRDGRSVRARHVVVAAGCDSVALLQSLGVDLPIEPEERHLFLSEPIRERLVEPLVVSPERRFAAKQLGSGRVLASDLSPEGDTAGRRASVRRSIRELLPVLEYVEFTTTLSGVYDVTPDRQAILGQVPGHDRVWVAAGFSGHGFMLAPAVGRILASAIAGEGFAEALEVLGPSRFAQDRLVPEPQVI